MKRVLAVFAMLILASQAYAVTFTYDLNDHPDGAKAGTYGYGLRMDGAPGGAKFFSFDSFGTEVATVKLYIDTDADYALIQGEILENDAAGYVSTWKLSYEMTGITIDDPLTGFFTATSGSGFIQQGADVIKFMGKTRSSGEAHFFDDNHRLGGHTGYDFAGAGWIGGGDLSMATNDFLYTATLDPGGPGNPPPPIPIPASGLLLLAGFGAMGLMKARRKA